jgi:hypothetical protein
MTRVLLTSLLLFAVLAPAAHAAWFAAEPVDGPADISRLAIDIGREETGGVAYVKRDAGGARAWLSILTGGVWAAPAPISGAGASEVAVAAGERGRLAVAWIEGGDVIGELAGGPPTRLSAGGGATGLAIEIGVNGVAYAVWSQAGDVRAARLEGAVWSPVPQPLDLVATDRAGEGALRPRVTVAADGSALVVWGEAGADGRTHVIARRIYGTTLSVLPVDATVDSFEGLVAGSADSPDVDVEFDRSFAWVVFRQDVGGRSRSLARRLRASTFEPAVALDGGVSSGTPRVAMSGLGVGHGVSAASGTIMSAPLRDDAFAPAARLDAGGFASSPQVLFSERLDTAVVWRSGDEATAAVRGRIAPEEAAFGAEVVLSRPDLGPVPAGALEASSNRVADVVVAMLQGAPGARHLTVAWHDRPPSRPVLARVRRRTGPRPTFRWTPGLEFIGPQTFRVVIDGRAVATTPRNRHRLKKKLRRGRHRVQVIGVDRRGQPSSVSRSQQFRVRAKKKRG